MSRETTRYFIFLVLLMGEASYKALFLVLLVGEAGYDTLFLKLKRGGQILGEQTLFFVSQAVLQRG